MSMLRMFVFHITDTFTCTKKWSLNETFATNLNLFYKNISQIYKIWMFHWKHHMITASGNLFREELLGLYIWSDWNQVFVLRVRLLLILKKQTYLVATSSIL